MEKEEKACYLRMFSVVSAGPEHSFTPKTGQFTGMKPSHTMPLCVFLTLGTFYPPGTQLLKDVSRNLQNLTKINFYHILKDKSKYVEINVKWFSFRMLFWICLYEF